jgi:hypothetical protein
MKAEEAKDELAEIVPEEIRNASKRKTFGLVFVFCAHRTY